MNRILIIGSALVYYGRSRPDMNQGCLEKLPDLDFVKWIWTYPVRHRPGILKMLSDAELAGKRVIIAKSPRELSDRIEQIKNSG